MRCREFLEEHVQLIERLVGRACRRVGIASSEIGDMASMVKLALVENDYAILRRYEGRSAIATYLTVCIQRLLADHRERTHGRWRPSPEAQRLGEGAVVIEDVVQRQGRSLEEALPFVRAVDATATLEQVSAIGTASASPSAAAGGTARARPRRADRGERLRGRARRGR